MSQHPRGYPNGKCCAPDDVAFSDSRNVTHSVFEQLSRATLEALGEQVGTGYSRFAIGDGVVGLLQADRTGRPDGDDPLCGRLAGSGGV